MNETELAAAAAISAAVDVGVLDALADETPAEAVAHRCGLDPRLTGLLLDALEATGVASPSPHGSLRLAESPLATRATVELWRGLPDALRSGRPLVDVSRPPAAAAVYALIADRLAGYATPALAVVTAALAGRGPRVLDLGAGTAPWSRALAAADPSLFVTAVDLPGVTVITKRRVAADGLAHRMTVLTGDLFDFDPGTDFDLVLVAGVCRLFDEATNRRLACRAAALTRPGGAVAILDTLPDADRSDDSSIALYALGLALRTAAGGVHPFSSYAAWLHGAGLAGIDLIELPTPHLSLIRAERPA